MTLRNDCAPCFCKSIEPHLVFESVGSRNLHYHGELELIREVLQEDTNLTTTAIVIDKI